MKFIGESEWTDFLVEAGIDPERVELIAESRFDPFRRVYKDENACYKIVADGEISSCLRTNTLEQEYLMLKYCIDTQGTPKPIFYKKTSQTQLLATEYLPGVSLDKLNLDDVGIWNIVKGLVVINYRLAMIGISHDDLQASNILVSGSEVVHLVDFDQAKESGPTVAFVRSFFGLKLGGPTFCKTMPSIFLYLFKKKSPGTMNILYKTQNIFTRIKQRLIGKWRYMNVSHRLPELKEDASDNVKVMFVAWRMAQISDASSPGHLYAYYALEFEGYLFPGERPWVDRWGMLRAITDYSGKKIIELGCNMGLLTSYLMKYEGAKGALAVDMDEKIIEAAELVNNSLNVKVKHAIVNFDSKEEWEEELLEYKPDIIFALNVLNWVDDKERLLKFLGHFNKLIFEGHDSLEVEKVDYRISVTKRYL